MRFLARVKAARLTRSWLTVVSRLLFNGINWSGVSSRQYKHLRRSAEVTQRYETMSGTTKGKRVCKNCIFCGFISIPSLPLDIETVFLFQKEMHNLPWSPSGGGGGRGRAGWLLLKRLMVRWIGVCVCAHMENTCKRTRTHNLRESKPVYTKESVHKISVHSPFKGEMCNFCALCLVGYVWNSMLILTVSAGVFILSRLLRCSVCKENLDDIQMTFIEMCNIQQRTQHCIPQCIVDLTFHW